MSLDKYRNRIKNLLDRAAACEGTPEGDLCRTKAFELAAKYALDPDEVQHAGDTAAAGQTAWEWRLTGSYKPPQRELLPYISTALHCRVLYSQPGTGSVYDLLDQADQDTAVQVGRGAALALLDDASAAEQLLQDYVHDAGLALRNGRRQARAIDRAAMRAGSEEGYRVDLGNSRLPQRRQLSA